MANPEVTLTLTSAQGRNEMEDAGQSVTQQVLAPAAVVSAGIASWMELHMSFVVQCLTAFCLFCLSVHWTYRAAKWLHEKIRAKGFN